MRAAPRTLLHFAPGLLGFAAGYTDTTSYLGLDGLFTAHVTGNLVVLGARLANEQTDQALLRVALIPLFGAAVAVSYAFVQRARQLGRSPAATLLVAEGAFLGAASLAGWALRRELVEHAASAVAAVGMLAVVGMGVQNALMRLVYGGQAQTTVMTGNLTQLVVDLVRWLSHRSVPNDAEERAEALVRLHKVGMVTAGFVVGAAAGAAVTHCVGLVSLALPTLIVFALAAGDLGAGAAVAGGTHPNA